MPIPEQPSAFAPAARSSPGVPVGGSNGIRPLPEPASPAIVDGRSSWGNAPNGDVSGNGPHLFGADMDLSKVPDSFIGISSHFEGQVLILLEGLRESIMHNSKMSFTALMTDFQWQAESLHMKYRAALEALQEENARLRKLAGYQEEETNSTTHSEPVVNFKTLGEIPVDSPTQQSFSRWIKGGSFPVLGETPVARKWGELTERAEQAAQARSVPYQRLHQSFGQGLSSEGTRVNRWRLQEGDTVNDRPARGASKASNISKVITTTLIEEQAHEAKKEEEEDQKRAHLKSAGTVQLQEILNRKSSVKSSVKLSHAFMNKLVIRPYDSRRLAWDVLGTLFLLYDAIIFPLMALSPPDWPLSSHMKWITAIYWLCDLPSQFFLGYRHHSGFVEMNFSKVARHYLRSWFAPDFVIVALDLWFLVMDVLGELGGALRMGKSLRFLRILRTLRLLRTGRVLALIQKMEDKIQNEALLMFVKISKLMLMLLMINHYVGCLFYLVGSMATEEGDDGPSWVKHYKVEADSSNFAWRYLTCLTWSLAQFTPSASEVQPKNPIERAFAVMVVLGGMVCFSSFVSTITSTIAQLRAYSAEQEAEEHQLRLYLLHNGVSPDLSARIWEFVRTSSSAAKKGRTSENKVNLLNQLPHSLLAETRAEVYAPIITRHVLFQYLANTSLSAFYDVCYHSMTMKTVLVNRDLFLRNSRCSSMYWVVEGTLKYDVGTYPKVTQEDRNFVAKFSKDSEAMMQQSFITSGCFLCEPALWINRWVSKGSTVALSHVEAFQLSCFQFAKAVMDIPEIHAYRQKFVAHMKLYKWSDLCSDYSLIEKMANEAFPLVAETSTDWERATSTMAGVTRHGVGAGVLRPLADLIGVARSPKATGGPGSPTAGRGAVVREDLESSEGQDPDGLGYQLSGGFGSVATPKTPGIVWGRRST